MADGLIYKNLSLIETNRLLSLQYVLNEGCAFASNGICWVA